MTENKYLCMTADIVSSRSHKVSILLDDLPARLDDFNDKFRPSVPLSISAGDEIQGLFKLDQQPLTTAFMLLVELYPLALRVGLGIGSISTQIRKTTAMMRGHAFENARLALLELKKNQIFSLRSNNNIEIAVNACFLLATKLIYKWDEKTYNRFKLYYNNGSIHETAKAEKVSPEAINKYIHRNSIREIIHVLSKLDELLQI